MRTALWATGYVGSWLPTFSLVALWAIMQWHGKLPSSRTIQEFIAVLNSRGGNIVILGGVSIYFFRHSMYLFNVLLGMVKDNTISQDNAFALMALQFVTSSAFGGAFGAMLKTMTGESSRGRQADYIQVTNGVGVSGNGH